MASKVNPAKQGRQVAAFDDLDLDELLAKLTPEEIDELNNEVDPDNSLLPPSQRCRDQTTKTPTGKFDREKLIRFLEEKAKNEKDWEQNKPFVKEERGKKFVPKKDDSNISKDELSAMGFDIDLEDDVNQVLQNASEEELVDLAGILGFTGMLTQEQVQAAIGNRPQEFGGFNSVAKFEKLKLVPDEPPNTTDVEASIQRLKDNAADLKELNLNNIKTISAEKFERLCEALHGNTNLESLSCANIHLTNGMAEPLLDVLRKNNTLKKLNLESNFLTGELFVKLLRAANRPECALTDLRLCNQRQHVLGVQVEQEITKIILLNTRIQRLGIDLETADALIRVRDHIASNVDKETRQKRRSKSRDR